MENQTWWRRLTLEIHPDCFYFMNSGAVIYHLSRTYHVENDVIQN